jgi:hypothetical protein
MKSSLYYFPYWFPGIITQINSRQEVERTSEMFMLYFSRGRIVNNSLQTSNLRQGHIKLLVASWAPLRYYFNRLAEVSVTMGEWVTVNFCPCYHMSLKKYPNLPTNHTSLKKYPNLPTNHKSLKKYYNLPTNHMSLKKYPNLSTYHMSLKKYHNLPTNQMSLKKILQFTHLPHVY